jgi:hypothetical protein
MSRMPHFLIIGAARAGTTTLHDLLRRTPGIFMPASKEPNFFAYEGETLRCRGPGASFINDSVTRLDRYQALFEPAPPGAILGEASPLYLFEPRAPERIRHHLPEARLVAVLRDPVEQAFSHFLYAKAMGIEPLDSFTEALHREEERLAQGWQPLFGYSRFPRYGEQIARYLALFPRERMLIRTYEDFQASPQAVLADVLAFVGADPAAPAAKARQLNAGGVPRNAWLHDLLVKPNALTRPLTYVLPVAVRRRLRDRFVRLNLRRDVALPAEARAILHERLDDDIRRLTGILDRDLAAWLA